jgi:hypothetical protein
MRSILVGIIMLSMSTAVVHTAETERHTQMRPSYMQALVGHRQLTQNDVTDADQIQLDKKSVETDNELLDLPPTQYDVTGADQVRSDENGLGKRIERENDQLDRQLRGICRGC